MDYPARQEMWALLGQALVDHDVPAGGNRRLRAGTWASRMRSEQAAPATGRRVWREGVPAPDAGVIEAVAAVRAGLGVADLFVMASAARLHMREGWPNGTAMAVQHVASQVLPFLSLGAMVGWLAVEGSLTGTDDPFGQVFAWAKAGMGEDGWVYAGAGLTVAEALAARADGSMDRDTALVLAALRGAPLPAT